MRSQSLMLLAGLASYALALPADLSMDRRTLGLGLGIDLDLSGVIGGLLGGGQSPANLLTGLSAQGAAALQGGALGCKAGVIHADARAELKGWLNAHADVNLDVSLKTSLLKWCDGEDSLTLSVDVCAGLSVLIPSCADIAAKSNIFVTLDGILGIDHLAADVILASSVQSSLNSFITGSHGAALDAKIKAGLKLSAGGGVISSLSDDLKASLKVWLSGSDCTLSVDLKASVQAWLEGKTASGVVSIGQVPSGGLVSLSVGASVGAGVQESGILAASAQASLSGFLKADVSADIEAHIKTALSSCAQGGHATGLSIEARTALTAWIHSSKCSLGAELKSVLLFWLSFAVTADVSVDISGGLVGDLLGFLTNTVDSLLGTSLHGIISVLLGGESLLSISLDARAQLAAVLGGGAGVELDTGISIHLIGWITGCSLSGSPSGPGSSSVPALPASSTVPVSVPAGSVVPTSATPSGASSTPCDTITSESVVPIATESSSQGASPVGSTSAPSVPAVPTSSAQSGSASSSVPVSSQGASSTPCDTLTSESVYPVATETAAPSVKTTAVVVPPAVTSAPAQPAPIMTGPPKVVTVHTTLSVCACN